VEERLRREQAARRAAEEEATAHRRAREAAEEALSAAMRRLDEERAARERAEQQLAAAEDALRAPLSAAATVLARFALPTEQRKGFKTALLPAATAEHAMLRALWDAGGPGGGPNRYTLRRVEVVETERQRKTFKSKVEDFEIRRSHASGLFSVAFSDSAPAVGGRGVHDPIGEKRAVLARLKQRFVALPGLQRANALLVFHGCTHAAADGICQTGFASISTTDAGFFGRGIYTTTYAQYACEYATGAITGTSTSPDPATGEHVVLVAWATPGLAYPVTRGHAGPDCDYRDSGSGESRFFAGAGEPAKALRAPFDSH